MSYNLLHRGRTPKAAEALLPSSPAERTKDSLLSCLTGSRRSGLLGPLGRILLVVAMCGVVLLLYAGSLSVGSGAKHEVSTEPAKGPPPVTERYVNDGALNHVYTTSAPGQAVGPLSPKLSILVPPFKDLCEWISPTHKLSMAATVEMPAAAVAADVALRAKLESVLNRFEHVPADGGDAGRRWSAATGLPLAADRVGKEVKVRFLTVTNRVDKTTHFATVAAAMAGVRLDMIGMGWQHFSFMKRLSLLVSYAELENLTDADVIMATDADAVMSGEDALPFFSAFVASTAASEAEHMTYRVRDIRMGKRQPPIIWSAERTCWAYNTFMGIRCVGGHDRVYDLREKWITSTNESMQRGFNKHAFRFLNAGVMVTRVWALRLLKDVFRGFIVGFKPLRRKKYWTCDQSAFASLYLDLLKWELESKAWDGAPREFSTAEWKELLYPPKQTPKPGYGPHNLPPGFLGLDQNTRLSLTIEPSLDKRGVYTFGGRTIQAISHPEPSVTATLTPDMPVETSPMGLVTTRSRLAMTPRSHVDCVGVANVPPECAYRDAVWGIPPGAKAVVPLLWHFSGDDKILRFAHYRTLFPWYLPTLINTGALQNLVHVFSNLPPTRVFAIDPATNDGTYMSVTRVLPHNASDDISTYDVCRVSVLKSH